MTSGDQEATKFIYGGDAAEKRTVASLAEALGFEPVDVDPLRSRVASSTGHCVYCSTDEAE